MQKKCNTSTIFKENFFCIPPAFSLDLVSRCKLAFYTVFLVSQDKYILFHKKEKMFVLMKLSTREQINYKTLDDALRYWIIYEREYKNQGIFIPWDFVCGKIKKWTIQPHLSRNWGSNIHLPTFFPKKKKEAKPLPSRRNYFLLRLNTPLTRPQPIQRIITRAIIGTPTLVNTPKDILVISEVILGTKSVREVKKELMFPLPRIEPIRIKNRK